MAAWNSVIIWSRFWNMEGPIEAIEIRRDYSDYQGYDQVLLLGRSWIRMKFTKSTRNDTLVNRVRPGFLNSDSIKSRTDHIPKSQIWSARGMLQVQNSLNFAAKCN